MINCIPYGGISNRMKCIISSLAEYEDINLIWEIPRSGGGVRCEFNDLFKNTYNGTSNKKVSDCKFIHPHMNTYNDGEKNNIPSNEKEKYLNIIKTLEPVDYVIDRVNEEHSKLGSFTTVSVRTFKSFQHEYNSWGRFFKRDCLVNFMDEINGKILLTCDDPDTVTFLKNNYDVYTTPKRTNFGDFLSVEGMQDILIDLYLGGLGNKIYGTNMSSFSEMQWWFGLCNAEYIKMDLHQR